MCGARDPTIFTRRPAPPRVLVCASCTLGFTYPQPAPAELVRLYARYGDVAAAPPWWIDGARRWFSRALAARVRRAVPLPARALDIGCGDASVLDALARRGFTCTGVDLMPRPTARGHARGVELRRGAFEGVPLAEGAWRVVLLRHVLEHLADPGGALATARRLIAPDGLLIVAVPNLASWQARIARDAWLHLNLPEHLFHFTPAALTRMLARAGFDVVRISHWSFEYGPYGWLQSLFNRAGGRWRTLDTRLRWSATPRRPADPIVIAAAVALAPVCVIASALESMAGAGGAIEAWARPS